MASGNTIFVLTPNMVNGPSSNAATLDIVQDGSTPPLEFHVLDFDGAADEHADFQLTIPSQYSGATGFTFSYKYATDGSDADLVELEFRVLHIDDLDVLTGDLGIDTQTPVAIQDTPPATPTDKFSYSTTGTLAKANFGSAVAGDYIVVRVTRDISAATNTDDLQLAEIYVTET